jgi:signal transduction histidine kinase
MTRPYHRRVSIRAGVAAHLDPLVAGVLGVLYVSEVLFSGELTQNQGAGVAVALFFASSFLARRTLPLVPLLAAVAVIEINHTVLHGIAEGGAFMLGLVIALYSGTRHARGWMLPACVVVSVAIIPLAALDPHQPPSVGDWIFFATFIGFPTVAGRIFYRRHETDERLARENADLAADRDRRAAEAVAEERARIARELHDVVAHAISVIVLQARGGRRVLASAPDDATTAFDTIEHTGEQALDEMRRLLAMLRYDGEPGLSPQPGLHALDDLAGSVTRMGLPVEVVREGTPVELSAGIDLSAYRIVQEALTNALKHAGPARARVRVSFTADHLDLEVFDDGPGTGGGGGSGHGLLGIRERAELYGGHVEAGRCPEGGYAVRARLPIGATA